MRIATFVAILLAGLSLTAGARAQEVTTYSVQAPFEEVSQDLGDAIINHGYKIDYHAFIGDMLKRTAKDVGAKKSLYKDAQFMQFCSAVASRQAMEADIGNIAFCPYVLFVYEAADDPGTVVVGFRRLPEGGGRDHINNLLDEIAREAAGEL